MMLLENMDLVVVKTTRKNIRKKKNPGYDSVQKENLRNIVFEKHVYSRMHLLLDDEEGNKSSLYFADNEIING